MSDDAVQLEVIPGKKKKPPEDEFGDVLRSLSRPTQEMFRKSAPPPTYRAPVRRYGGTPPPMPAAEEDAPANLREADTELRRRGYSKGSREGERILRAFGTKKKE